MKNFKKILKMASVSMMLVALMACSMFMVSAAPAVDELNTGGTAADPAGALLRKVLELPVGVNVPASTFTFKFDAVTVDGIANDDTNMPEIENKTISFTSFDPAGASVPTDVAVDTATKPGVVIVSKDSAADILSTPTPTWPHAGEYVYTVTEVTGTEDINSGKMTYSTESYQMTVYVVNEIDSGSFTGDYYVRAVGFKKLVDSTMEKADPVFTNQYRKTTELEVSKEVEGDYADTTKDFNFVITMVKSPLETTADASIKYTGKVYDKDGALSPEVAFDVEHDGMNLTGTFKLKHGQYIVFEGLPAGTTYTLSEDLTAANEKQYTPSVGLTVNGDVPGAGVGAIVNADRVFTIGGTTPINLGEGDNFADWTNTHAEVNPTGILLNNLPFILLILAAIGGFIWFVVAKRRKAAK